MNIDDLADIVEPAAVPWTPQTIGWWILLVVLVVVVAMTANSYRRRQSANRYRREAIAALDSLERPTVGAVNAVLKRTAMTADTRAHVATLSGPAWVTFLLDTGPTNALGDEERELLSDGSYSCRNADGAAVLPFARSWILGHRVQDQRGA